jgi:hypothetical protein
MDEEVIGVGVLRGIWEAGLRVRAFVMTLGVGGVPIREDYYFVDAEDGESAGDVASEGGT